MAMSLEVKNILEKIEQRRKEMIELGLARSFADKRVLELSDQLDKLLN
jgi:hypothetical protein